MRKRKAVCHFCKESIVPAFNKYTSNYHLRPNRKGEPKWKICRDCMLKEAKEQMANVKPGDKFWAELIRQGDRWFVDYGGLKFPCSPRERKHNWYGCKQVYVNFRGPGNRQWFGRAVEGSWGGSGCIRVQPTKTFYPPLPDRSGEIWDELGQLNGGVQ